MSLIREDKLKLKGSSLGPENPQPFFRQPDPAVAAGPDFPPDKKYSFGQETGFRVLPYTMQDRYSRELVDMEFPSIVMENDQLRAEIIPALGGRLWSLFDKKQKREILYRNPIFRPANLAIRDAWFSGGVEWNIGRLGHTVHCCSPVFAGLVKEDGFSVLRLWEFERQSRLFWRIDLSLGEDSCALFVYTRIENPDNNSKPLYWWTNSAVPQSPGVRVFSNSDEVIYVVPMPAGAAKTMDYGKLPNLPVLPGRDASYPALSDYSNEYFFQNDRSANTLPWEAAVYEDGYSFGEVSTPPLLYRKMFCWGSGRGGRRWQDFLSLPGGQEYLEVQAGLAPTQLHTADISGGGSIDWVQAFCAFQAEPEKAFQENYRAATAHVSACLEKQIPPGSLNEALENFRSYADTEPRIINMGSGWGALEERLKKRPSPKGLSFPAGNIGPDEAPWAELLAKGRFPPQPVEDGPGSFAVDEAWEPLLEKCDEGWLAPYHLGVIAFERGDGEKALAHWKESIRRKENPWACRNLALAADKAGDSAEALEYYRRAMTSAGNNCQTIDQSFFEEFIPLLLSTGREEEAQKELDAHINRLGSLEALSSPILEAAARLALIRRDDAMLEKIFSIEQAHIREGKNTMVELWTEWQIQKGNGPALSDGSLLPPREIDFRMFTG